MIVLGWLLAGFGMIVLLVSALGILRLPDALSRQHAATKAATLAITLFSTGLLCIAIGSGWGWQWSLRLVVMMLLLMLTLPLASHALARAAIAEARGEK
jgi:multicomponent Na+:H+ antiporter subunit G